MRGRPERYGEEVAGDFQMKRHEPGLTKEHENQISKIKNQNDNAKFKKDKDNA